MVERPHLQGREPVSHPPLYQIAPAWGGDEAAREAWLERELADAPRCTGLRYGPSLVIPGSPPALCSIGSELLWSEQARRDMTLRWESMHGLEPEAAAQLRVAPREGRGLDDDLCELAAGVARGAAAGADLRSVPWAWLQWACFEATPSVRSVLEGLPHGGLVTSRLGSWLGDILTKGEAAMPPSGWGRLRRSFDDLLEVSKTREQDLACWVPRFGLVAREALQSTGMTCAARCWTMLGGGYEAGLRELARLVSVAPAWPAEVRA